MIHRHPLIPTIVLLFHSLFCSADICFGRLTPRGFRTYHGPVTEGTVLDHLLGNDRYGISLVDVRGHANLLCIHVDEDLPSIVTEILGAASGFGLAAYVVRTPPRGYRVWIFFTTLVPVLHLERLGRRIAAKVGAPLIDVFPSPGRRQDPSCWVPLPLHGFSMDAGLTAFVDPGNGFVAYDDQHEFLGSIRCNSVVHPALTDSTTKPSPTLKNGRVAVRNQGREERGGAR